MTFTRISGIQAKTLMEQQGAQVVDIRDEQSYQLSHIKSAQHIDNHSISGFLETADKNAPLIVCCYHGNSSQSAAGFFAEQGFAEVYSLDGGFEDWRNHYPEQCT